MIKKNIFYAFLIHNTESIKYASQEIKQLFNYLKNKYQNLKVGFSIYEPKDISLINKYNIQLDIIQSPLNIFDRRLIESKYFLQLKKKNIEIHVRSCFFARTTSR